MIKHYFLLLFLVSFVTVSGQNSPVSADVVIQSLAGGKTMRFNSKVYYNPVNGQMVQHFISPRNYYILSNKKGEGKLYFPEKNSVSYRMGDMMNSENSSLGLFMRNSTQDMGLSVLGYGVDNTRFDGEYEISTWRTTKVSDSPIDKIELVHSRFKPVYMCYYDKKGSVLRKVFYYNYIEFGAVSVPGKITEIDYLSETDSVVTRTMLSNLSAIEETNAELNITIPANAATIK